MSFDFEQAAKIKAVDFKNTLKEKFNGYLQINESTTGNQESRRRALGIYSPFSKNEDKKVAFDIRNPKDYLNEKHNEAVRKLDDHENLNTKKQNQFVMSGTSGDRIGEDRGRSESILAFNTIDKAAAGFNEASKPYASPGLSPALLG